MEILPKFEAKWLEEDDCEQQVMRAWERVTQEGSNSLVKVQRDMLLWKWERNVLEDLEKELIV